MPKSRRTVLSGLLHPTESTVTPIRPEIEPVDEADTVDAVVPAAVPKTRVRAVPAPAPAPRRRDAFKEATIQQTVYLPPAVHDQLRELAFSERVKMHALIMEGLDAVFRKRGMKPISSLAPKD